MVSAVITSPRHRPGLAADDAIGDHAAAPVSLRADVWTLRPFMCENRPFFDPRGDL